MKTPVKRKRILLLFAWGLAASIGIASGTRAQQPVPGDAGLQPGDAVQITVWQREELSGEFTVTPDGSLNHPLYRQVRVTGIPAGQVEERVRSFISQFEANPQLVVQPLYRVALAGPVMRPDIYNVPPGTTVGQLISQAGGVLENGDREEVLLTRGVNEIELDLTQAEAMLMPVQSGDQILVDSSGGLGAFREAILPALQVATTIAHLIYIGTDRN